ncbi:hypothetical protein WJ23_18475 [Burkholderia lata]|nr:hypothetical protein WJ23_18475 [Burkholderia lata]
MKDPADTLLEHDVRDVPVNQVLHFLCCVAKVCRYARPGCKKCRCTLEGQPHFKYFAEITRSRRCDIGPALFDHDDQPFGFEQMQCAAHGHLAEAEFVRQASMGYFLSRRKAAVKDPRSDLVVGKLCICRDF